MRHPVSIVSLCVLEEVKLSSLLQTDEKHNYAIECKGLSNVSQMFGNKNYTYNATRK